MAKITWSRMPDGIGWNKARSLRKASGLTIAEVAVGAGLPEPTVQRIETGKEGLASITARKKLAAFFKCDLEDVFPAEMVGDKPKAMVFSTTIGHLEEPVAPFVAAGRCEPAPAAKALASKGKR